MKRHWKRAAALTAAVLTAVGTALPASAGWELSQDNSWRYTENGVAASGGWKKIDGIWYNFDPQGIMRTGWYTEGGVSYYLRENGAMVNNGWQLDGESWYFFLPGGAMAKGWVQSGGNWYFMDSSGKMQTGAVQVSGVNYTFDSSGKMTGEGDAVVAIPLAAFDRSGNPVDIVYPQKDGRTTQVTLIENYSVEKIAQLLNDKGVCPKAEFLAAVNRVQGFAFDSEIPEGVCYRYEGYLYPDTYEFYLYEDADTVVRKLLKNFESKMTGELLDEIEASGRSLHETMTLASIVQAEAGKKEEMEAVSAIFQNRLNNPAEYPKLQSNPTSSYAKNVVLPATGDEALAASYDSYQLNGLIAGPINNPGLQAIQAVLHPSEDAEGSYFFCTDKAGNFYFAKTYQEHLENCQKAGLTS